MIAYQGDVKYMCVNQLVMILCVYLHIISGKKLLIVSAAQSVSLSRYLFTNMTG